MIPIKKQKSLKHSNRKVILNYLHNSGETTIAELSKVVNLSKPTLLEIMNYYVKNGLVVITGKGNSTEEGGKRPNIYKFNENGGFSVGMCISANKLKSVITNLNGEVLCKRIVTLDHNEELDSIINRISDSYYMLLDDAEVDNSKIMGLGVGIYGATDPNKGIVFYSPHYPSWGKNIEMSKKIKEKIPECSNIIIDNSPRFEVFAEKSLGTAKNFHNIVSIFAGYGLGSGIILADNIQRGSHMIIGEIGHMVINPSEEMICACGGRGCFEVMVCIDRLKKLIESNRKTFPDSVLYANVKDRMIGDITPEEIFAAYKNKDKLVTYAMNDIIKWFSVGLSNLILAYDPQIIVINGLYTKAGDEFLKNLVTNTRQISLTSIKKETEIRMSQLGNTAGVLGAAAYVIKNFFE